MICRAIPYEGKEPYIFISYCHKDKSQVYPILEQMARDSYRIWYDDGNHAGDEWTNNIETHLEACKAVVAFISNDSSVSHNCKSEITYALKCKKKIVPILIDSADLPKGLRMQLSYLHYLKKSDFSSDQVLLNKIYELEECRECKAAPGSIPLRRDSVVEERKEKRNIPEKPAVNKASHAEETPREKGHRIRVLFPKKNKEPEHVTHEPNNMGSGENAHVEPKTNLSEKKGSAAPNVKSPVKKEMVMEQDWGNDSTTVSTTGWDDEDETVYENDEKTVYKDVEADEDLTVRQDNRHLALLLHPAAGKAYVLRKPQEKIGRSPAQCDVVIEGNSSVSKHHADIIQFNQKCFLIDTKSTYGTYVKGEQLKSEKQVELENPAIFKLSDEILILISGKQAKERIAEGTVVCLTNEEETTVCVMETEQFLLNRNHIWPDGTLSDKTIHREAHAKLDRKEDGIYLIDESPHNATCLNGKRLGHGESRMLSSGDVIRLGDHTNLHFMLIKI